MMQKSIAFNSSEKKNAHYISINNSPGPGAYLIKNGSFQIEKVLFESENKLFKITEQQKQHAVFQSKQPRDQKISLSPGYLTIN